MVSPFRVRDILSGCVTCGNLRRDSDVLERRFPYMSIPEAQGILESLATPVFCVLRALKAPYKNPNALRFEGSG